MEDDFPSHVESHQRILLKYISRKIQSAFKSRREFGKHVVSLSSHSYIKNSNDGKPSDDSVGENEAGRNREKFEIEAVEKSMGGPLNILVKQVSITPS